MYPASASSQNSNRRRLLERTSSNLGWTFRVCESRKSDGKRFKIAVETVVGFSITGAFGSKGFDEAVLLAGLGNTFELG